MVLKAGNIITTTFQIYSHAAKTSLCTNKLICINIVNNPISYPVINYQHPAKELFIRSGNCKKRFIDSKINIFQ